MLKLNAPQGAWSITLGPGAVLHLRGVQPADMVIARDTAAAFSSGAPKTDFWGIFWATFAQVLLTRLLTGWEGIGDAQGNVVAPSPESITALLSIPQVYSKIEETLIHPLYLRIEEKNASSPSLNGTSAGASKAEPPREAGSLIAGTA